MLAGWIFTVFLPLLTSSIVLQDPEFDEDNTNWILASRSVIMMKNLPKGANYTVREYYRSWNMVYEEELAKKDIAYASAPFIDTNMVSYKSFRPQFTILFNIQIVECGEKRREMLTRYKKEEYFNKTALISWNVDYCGTETVLTWCDMGRRPVTRMTASSKINQTQVEFKANITATCPGSIWASITLFFHKPDTADAPSHFTWPFWVAFGILVVAIFIGAGSGFVVGYRRYREWKEQRKRDRFNQRFKKINQPNSEIVELEMHEIPKRK